MKKEKKEKNIIKLFLNLLIVLLVLYMFEILFSIVFISGYEPDLQVPKVSTVYFMLEQGRLDETLEVYHFCEKSGREVKKEKELASFTAMGEYLEEASYYRVYLKKGEGQKASECWKKMQDAKSDMGELSFYSDKINRMVGIE